MENKKLWFKRKRYGYGYVPVTWEGWLTILVYAGVVTKIVILAHIDEHSGKEVLIFVSIPVLILTILLIAVCRWKGPSAKWSWGKDKDTV